MTGSHSLSLPLPFSTTFLPIVKCFMGYETFFKLRIKFNINLITIATIVECILKLTNYLTSCELSALGQVVPLLDLSLSKLVWGTT